ncbi:MAG: DUF2497 domain-containing protein [Alphaproteobacteria bacterium]|nr:DUF2497 domain-containing protein [Alphaproteobacteria bacterium]
MAEDQEISMNEILSSIRQILSDDTQKNTEPLDDAIEDVFVLTPAMKYQPTNKTNIQDKLKLVLNKLAEHKADMNDSEYRDFVNQEVRPILTTWMSERIPDLLKDAVDQEIKKLLK